MVRRSDQPPAISRTDLVIALADWSELTTEKLTTEKLKADRSL
jgi:hypothetical protein